MISVSPTPFGMQDTTAPVEVNDRRLGPGGGCGLNDGVCRLKRDTFQVKLHVVSRIEFAAAIGLSNGQVEYELIPPGTV